MAEMYAEERVGAALAVPAEEWVLPERPSIAATVGRFIRRKPLGAFGMLIVLILLTMTLGAPKAEFGWPALTDRPLGFELGMPWLARYDADAVFYDRDTGRIASWQEPNVDHWLGTDRGGRDTFSRIVWGARRSLFVGLWALAFAVVAGTFVGIISAYFRGWFDTLLQRFMDALQAFPALLILLLLLSLFPPNLTVLAFGLGFVGITSVQRIVRGVVLSTREQPYIEAARVLGASDVRTMVFHILPNVMAPIIVIFSIGLGAVILAEAALAFIAPQRVPQDAEGVSWGLMLNEGRSFMFDVGMWLTIVSGGVIALAVLGFNLAGDALRDVLDPRLRLG